MKKKEKKRLPDYDTTGNLGVTEMVGAILSIALGGFKKDYTYYYKEKYRKKNILIGYITSIILVVLLILFMSYVV